MKDTDFNIRLDDGETKMYLPEFGSMLTFDENGVYVVDINDSDKHYRDYENDLSPILHWINHMYNVDGMRETLVNPAGLSGNTKTFRRVYNQLMKQSNAYKLKGVSVIADTE